MEIIKTANGSELNVALKGRLDTSTAPELEAALRLDGVTKLVFDLEGLEYISSAGLRLFLTAQKTMMKQGEMILRNVCTAIMDVFEITGFVDILTIE